MNWHSARLSTHGIGHSLIISREVLILTLSIFNALKVCISWYSLATGLKSEATTYQDHIIRYSPCALGSVQRNTSLGTVFPRTLPRESIGNTSSRGNIGNAPAMMYCGSLLLCCRQAKCTSNGCKRQSKPKDY